ncbi:MULTISPECIES: hypothetical protein [unclassified Nostoc]|nr:hypothetical protein [Nostoc sp. 'Peltigera membranacea cyanobiont' 213]
MALPIKKKAAPAKVDFKKPVDPKAKEKAAGKVAPKFSAKKAAPGKVKK